MTFNSSGSNQDSQAIANFNDTGVTRNFSLDVLRGIALLGILLISIWEFGGFSINEQTRLRLLQKGTDYNLYYYISVFFEGKMRALFSLVFGAGILLFMAKPNRPGLVSTHELYIRRNMWLMGFGIFNAIVLLWPGDILFQYGVMGILLFPFFRMSRRALLIAALVTTLIYCGKMYWNYADDKKAYKKFKAVTLVEQKFKKDSTTRHQKDSIAGLSKDSLIVRDSIGKKNDTLNKEQAKDKGAWEGMVKNLKYDSTNAAVKKDNKEMRSGYGKIWNYLLQRSQFKEAAWLYRTGIWDIGSMILLSMALFGFGFFSADFSKSKYLIIAAMCLIAGFLLAWLKLDNQHSKLVDYAKYIDGHAIPPNQFFPIERLLLATGYAAFILFFIRVNILKWLWGALSAVGKMAITNYFMQTLICTLFFYGYGFGYFGRLSLLQLYFLVAEIWLIQTVFSIIWLRYYHHGPVEWLWRYLIYGKRFPNKKKME